MADVDDVPDITGKDSSEDQDIPSKCHDSVGDPVVSDKDDILNSSNENIKVEDGDLTWPQFLACRLKIKRGKETIGFEPECANW